MKNKVGAIIKRKQWKKVIGYSIPIIALVVANMLNINDPSQIETSLVILVTAILGVLSAMGVIKNNDKANDKQKK